MMMHEAMIDSGRLAWLVVPMRLSPFFFARKARND
ncbi:MAG: hypothetical protein ACI9C1_000512 [Candidatus Aldehydirespiratoraceae bacterium]|jgi:hypothetical protein